MGNVISQKVFPRNRPLHDSVAGPNICFIDNITCCKLVNPQTASNAIAIYSHGNMESISQVCQFYSTGCGYDFFKALDVCEMWFWEYSGYGCQAHDKNGNVITPTEKQIEVDALRVAEWAFSRSRVEDCYVVFVGRSLGGYAATVSALHFANLSKEQELQNKVQLVLISAFASLLHTQSWLSPRTHFLFEHFNGFQNINLARRLTCDTLLLHGENDTVVPKINSLLLAEKLNGTAVTCIFPSLSHNNVLTSPLVVDAVRNKIVSTRKPSQNIDCNL